MIFEALKLNDYPLELGSFNELCCLLLGCAYGDPAVYPLENGAKYDHADVLSDDVLLGGTLRHANMMLPFLDVCAYAVGLTFSPNRTSRTASSTASRLYSGIVQYKLK
jgi:hypothetical protein